MIVLVGCGKIKRGGVCEAKYMYTGSLFRDHFELAKAMPARKVAIVSAMYGVVDLDEVIEPYDLTVGDMSIEERSAWERKIVAQVHALTADDRELVVLLAGEAYASWVPACARRVRCPLTGFTLGERRAVIRAWLKGTREAEAEWSRLETADELSEGELLDELPELRIGGVAGPRRPTHDELFVARGRPKRRAPDGQAKLFTGEDGQ